MSNDAIVEKWRKYLFLVFHHSVKLIGPEVIWMLSVIEGGCVGCRVPKVAKLRYWWPVRHMTCLRIVTWLLVSPSEEAAAVLIDWVSLCKSELLYKTDNVASECFSLPVLSFDLYSRIFIPLPILSCRQYALTQNHEVALWNLELNHPLHS